MHMRYLGVLLALVLLMLGRSTPTPSAETPSAQAPVPAPSSAAASASENTGLPRFEDYATTDTFRGSVAPVRIETARYGRMFRTRLRAGARGGPNFAGAFTVVQWGCGSSCLIVSIVDARRGLLSEQTLRTTNGVQYRGNSRLIIADPVNAGDPPLSECAACGTPAAYVWTGRRFEPVGRGPHPHLSGERPW